MLRTIKLVFVMIWVSIKARSMYLTNFITALVQSIIMTAVSVGCIWIVLDKFKNINGWGFFEIGFMFGIAKLAISLVMAFFSVLFVMDMLINHGEIDRLLVRPKSPFILFVFQRFDIVLLGDIVTGLLIILYCADKVGIAWTVPNILLLIVMVVSATLTYFSLLFMTGATAFWFLKSGSLRNFMMSVFHIFSPYPIDIYSKTIQVILSVMLPFAFVYYFPSLHFLNKGSQIFPLWFAYVPPVVAALLTGLSVAVWHWGLRNYKSSGT